MERESKSRSKVVIFNKYPDMNPENSREYLMNELESGPKSVKYLRNIGFIDFDITNAIRENDLLYFKKLEINTFGSKHSKKIFESKENYVALRKDIHPAAEIRISNILMNIYDVIDSPSKLKSLEFKLGEKSSSISEYAKKLYFFYQMTFQRNYSMVG